MLFEYPYFKQKDFRVHIDSPLAHKTFSDFFIKILNETYTCAPIALCVLELTALLVMPLVP